MASSMVRDPSTAYGYRLARSALQELNCSAQAALDLWMPCVQGSLSKSAALSSVWEHCVNLLVLVLGRNTSCLRSRRCREEVFTETFGVTSAWNPSRSQMNKPRAVRKVCCMCRCGAEMRVRKPTRHADACRWLKCDACRRPYKGEDSVEVPV